MLVCCTLNCNMYACVRMYANCTLTMACMNSVSNGDGASNCPTLCKFLLPECGVWLNKVRFRRRGHIRLLGSSLASMTSSSCF